MSSGIGIYNFCLLEMRIHIDGFQANRTHQVTLITPPKSDIFHMFFSSLSGPVPTAPTPTPASAITPAPGMVPANMMSPYNFMMSPWMMPPPFGYPQTPNNPFYQSPKSPPSHRSRHRDRDEMPSSDPPEGDTISKKDGNRHSNVFKQHVDILMYSKNRKLFDIHMTAFLVL